MFKKTSVFYKIKCIPLWRWLLAIILVLGCAFFSVRKNGGSFIQLIIFQTNNIPINTAFLTLSFLLLVAPVYSFESNVNYVIRNQNKNQLYSGMVKFRMILVVSFILIVIVINFFAFVIYQILSLKLSLEFGFDYLASMFISLILLSLKLWFISILLTSIWMKCKRDFIAYSIIVVLFCIIDPSLYNFFEIMNPLQVLPHEYTCILVESNKYAADLLLFSKSIIYWISLIIVGIYVSERILIKNDLKL